jgi:hypothetical protein
MLPSFPSPSRLLGPVLAGMRMLIFSGLVIRALTGRSGGATDLVRTVCFAARSQGGRRSSWSGSLLSWSPAVGTGQGLGGGQVWRGLLWSGPAAGKAARACCEVRRYVVVVVAVDNLS